MGFLINNTTQMTFNTAPDRFASSDVCLGGCCQGVLAGNHGVSRSLVARACVDMCSGVGLKLLRIAVML